ncbi:molybdate ABC transporter substrate-binding protein [Kistimonas asteriae]|uniref:molybdate ABC transporter substrate-binding protein n=1 Tax=Kistimonas asteriae TaxID=517724 RepID=UPI001BA4AB87|nr:molybdate ABC transporter substrate-binding protein [Kistimonas asteriae]
MKLRRIGLALCFLLLTPLTGLAGELNVAVAANFRPVLETLAGRFQAQTGNTIKLSSASTGVLYNQITYGAPFDLFLSADARRPQMLEEQGLTEPGTRLPYAYGRLVLWHRNHEAVNLPALRTWQDHIAVANPVTAPYGKAADDVLNNLQLLDQKRPLLITGANILQTYQYVSSGNVALGFVAYAQLVTDGIDKGLYFVPEELYEPLRQEAVILKASRKKTLASDFLTWLQSPEVQRFIQAQGYYPARSVETRQQDNSVKQG